MCFTFKDINKALDDEINADYLLCTHKFGIKMDISCIPTFTHLLFLSFFCKALQDFQQEERHQHKEELGKH